MAHRISRIRIRRVAMGGAFVARVRSGAVAKGKQPRRQSPPMTPASRARSRSETQRTRR